MPLKNKVNVVTNSDITNDIAVSANVSIRNPISVRSGGSGDTYTKKEIDEKFSVVNEEITIINSRLDECGPSIQEIGTESECDDRTNQWYRIHDSEDESNDNNPFFVSITHFYEEDILTEPQCQANGTSINDWNRLNENFDENFSQIFAPTASGEEFEASYVYTAKYTIYEETEEVEDEETGEIIVQPVGDPIEFSALRVGASSKVGELSVPSLKGSHFKVTVGHYFSYNGVTYEKIYDESLAEVQMGTGTFELYNEPTTYDVYNDADLLYIHTMGNGRFFVYDIAVVEEERDETKHKEVVDKDQLDDDFEYFRHTEIEPIESSIEIAQQDINNLGTDVAALEDDVAEIEEKMGDIQIFDVDVLPEPGRDYLKVLYRCNGMIYQCVQTGRGSEDFFDFDNLSGTSEITSSNFITAMGDVSRVLADNIDDSFYELSKIYRNSNDGLKMGSSKAGGYLDFFFSRPNDNEPFTQITINFKNYSSTKTAHFYCELNDVSKGQDLEPGEESSFTFNENLDPDLTRFWFESDTNSSDKRIIVKSIYIKYGTEDVYEWQEVIGGGEGGERMSYEEAMDILEPFEIVGSTLKLSGSSTIRNGQVHLGYSATVDPETETIVINGGDE